MSARPEGEHSVQEAGGGIGVFIGEGLGVGSAEAVVDGYVDVLPAGAAAAACAIARDSMPDPLDPAELLDVEVDRLAGPVALVAHDGLRRLEVPEPRQPCPGPASRP